MRISPERLKGALKARGLPEPNLAVAKLALGKLGDDWHFQLAEHLQSIARATSDEESMQVLSWIAKATHNPEHVSKLGTVSQKSCEFVKKWQAALENPSVLSKPKKNQSDLSTDLHSKTAHADLERPKVKIFGRKSAMTAELDRTRPNSVCPNGSATVSIEMAASTGDGHFAWHEKFQFQFQPDELITCLSVLMGELPSFEWSGHGPENNKRLQLRPQPNSDTPGLLMRLTQANISLMVPMQPEASMSLASLLMRALLLNNPHLSSDTLLVICKRVGQMRKLKGTDA